MAKNLEKYVDKAKETLKRKNIINPKPAKRFNRLAESDEDTAENEKPEFRTPALPKGNTNENATLNMDESCLRPIRSAKTNAMHNLVISPINCTEN